MPARMKWRRHGLSTFASDFVVQRPTPPLWHIDAVVGRPPHQYTIPFRRTGQSRRLRHLSLTRMMVLKHGTYIPSPHSGRPRRCTAETATYSAEATWHPQEIFGSIQNPGVLGRSGMLIALDTGHLTLDHDPRPKLRHQLHSPHQLHQTHPSP